MLRVNNKYPALHRRGLLQRPVQHDTCWLPDLPQITMMLSHWAAVDYNTATTSNTQISSTAIHTYTCIKSHTRLQCWIHFPAQNRGWASGLDPHWWLPVGVWIFFKTPRRSSKRQGLTSRCFIVFVALIIHQADRSLSQQFLLMILSASPLSGAAACPEW